MSVNESAEARLIAGFSTASMPTHEKFSYFRDHISDVYCGIGAEQYAGTPFEAAYSAYDCGQADLAVMTTHGHRAARTGRLRSRTPDDSIFLNFCDNVDYQLVQGRQEMRVLAGMPVLIDNERDFSIATPVHGKFRLHSLRFPRRRFAGLIDRDQLDRINDRMRRSETGALVAMQMRLLCNAIRGGNLRAARAMAMPVFHLLDAMLVENDGGQREATGALSLESIKTIASQRAGNPAFSIAELASLIGATPRTVQNRFAEQGETFSDWLREYRLSMAYDRLKSAPPARGQIARIAFESGFADLSHFNRTYRARFGHSPGLTYQADAPGPKLNPKPD